MHEWYENSLWSTSATLKHKCGSLKRNSTIAPFSLFIFFFLFFYFCGLFGSFYLSLICPLWDISMCPLLGSFICVLFGIFSSLKGNTLYITRMMKITHFTSSTQHKENWKYIMMYANVCLCPCSRICNDTSASCSNYKGKAQLACSSTIKQKHVWQWKIKSWEDGCCMAMYLGKAMEMPWYVGMVVVLRKI